MSQVLDRPPRLVARKPESGVVMQLLQKVLGGRLAGLRHLLPVIRVQLPDVEVLEVEEALARGVVHLEKPVKKRRGRRNGGGGGGGGIAGTQTRDRWEEVRI